MMDTILLDKTFLKQLDYQQEKETYVRIISLSNDELQREAIEGKVSGGNINVDGSSAVRRTCSLTLNVLEKDTLITDKYWSYDNKFKLEIGLKNTINKNYPDIIWFKMGIYIITSFSVSKSTSGLQISISGKDKMCRLNGEVSGNIGAEGDFGKFDYIDEQGNRKITKLKIQDIILNMVKEYGQERESNIIINDLDDYGYELWKYRGDRPIYFFIEVKSGSLTPKIINMTLDGDTKVSRAVGGKGVALKELSEENGFKFYSLSKLELGMEQKPTSIKYYTDSSNSYYVAKVEYGETAGYHQTNLVYNSDLIANPGETVVSILDKLKAILGEFEYFYDLHGRFVFQKKKTYVQELFSPINGDIITPVVYASQYSYKFEDERLFTAISNTPNINNLKNDFSVWGTRKSASGADRSIHVRYAIDKKPEIYKSLDKDNTVYKSNTVDWRELIYQMAIDYQNHNGESDYLLELQNKNPQFANGKTGYEQYYTDLLGFWRQLYDPQGNSKEYYSEGDYKNWNKQIHENPNTLNFWFDFLDSDGELSKFSVNTYNPVSNSYQTNIGARTKVVKDSAIKSIYYKETPEVLFVLPGEEVKGNTSYTPIQIQSNIQDLFVKSAQGNSAISKVNELIAQHTTASEAIQLTTIPIYYLEPNTRIYVEGHGDYSLDKISYSLSYNGTMSLSGNKIMKSIY